MKGMSLLIWLTQLGLSVVVPLVAFIFLGIWLHGQFDWGQWCIWVGVILGILSAVNGLRSSLAAMAKLSANKDDAPPAVSFNNHD